MPSITQRALLYLAARLAVAYPQTFPPRTRVGLGKAQTVTIIGYTNHHKSGVMWLPTNQYDDNKDGCMRYKYAWSTVVNEAYPALLGCHLEDMVNQMDKLTRPKLVMMEAGDRNKDYGKNYEEDDPEHPVGECRIEIKNVRARLSENSIQSKVEETIHAWRAHKSVIGHDASLFLLGYGHFFALDKACDGWNFNVLYSTQLQNLTSGTPEDINDLAAEGFNDPKIQYVDVDPAFEGHRFCEQGDRYRDQINWGSKVYIWNSPARWWVKVTQRGQSVTYDTSAGDYPPDDIVDKLIPHREGLPRDEGEYAIVTFRDPSEPDVSMETRVRPDDPDLANGGGSIARTLRPTELGHKEMGFITVEMLKRHYEQAVGPIILPPPVPKCQPIPGCECVGDVLRCL
ncbi:hypothetical protein EK21DRAFT_102129 [Setomelanomma holmii]|uniref:Uncharacterized protein n=1 Tax=Setomelanomma holmii TaxID=210430 RepID=A0A9P4LIJ1_9PLEO|nr:hypothetical protein EK21DRAFT_102129 [Setomelanomma holmii]